MVELLSAPVSEPVSFDQIDPDAVQRILIGWDYEPIMYEDDLRGRSIEVYQIGYEFKREVGNRLWSLRIYNRPGSNDGSVHCVPSDSRHIIDNVSTHTMLQKALINEAAGEVEFFGKGYSHLIADHGLFHKITSDNGQVLLEGKLEDLR